MAYITFLIGNGFDINCNLKTSYKDFYPYYINNNDSDSKTLLKFKSDLQNFKDTEKWSDFEMGIAEYSETLENEDELIECVRDFRKKLVNYLRNVEETFLQEIKEENVLQKMNQETQISLNNFYFGCSKNLSSRYENQLNEYNFITFNYTRILDYLVRNYSNNYPPLLPGKSMQIIHIHGTIDDNAVLGLDNINQLKANYPITDKGLRTIIKPEYNKKYDISRIQEAENLISISNCLCIFGLSLGDSDLSWKKTIKKWLLSNVNNHLFFYDKSLIEKTNLDYDETQDVEDEKKKDILRILDLENNIQILQQIHLPCGIKLFNYTKILKDNENLLINNKEKSNRKGLFNIIKRKLKK